MKRSQPRHRLIMGKNCLQELLEFAPEQILQVYTSKDQDPLIDEIENRGILIKKVKKDHLSDMAGSDSHQSFIAEVKDKQFLNLQTYLEKEENRLVLMLDSINDPQNFGTLLRAAECFGVDAVVWSKNRGVDLTPVVSKASVGASELMPMLRVSNLVDTIKKFQEAGFWVVTAEVGEETQSLHSFEFPEKTLLVMGSEGKGVQPLISKNADFKIFIPMMGKIDSLNVSQATSVILSHWRKR